jgi:hypothetical protein
MGTYPDSWFRFQRSFPHSYQTTRLLKQQAWGQNWSPSMNCTRMFAFILVSSQECLPRSVA